MRTEGARDSAAAEDGDLASDQVATGLAEPRRRLHVRAEPAQAGERQRECQLGDRLGEDALAACPVAVVLDQMDERLDPCVGKLHPADLRRWRPSTASSWSAKRGLVHINASASSTGTTWPPPAPIAPFNQCWPPSGSGPIAIRGGPVRREDSDEAGLLGGMHREASSHHESRPQLFRAPAV